MNLLILGGNNPHNKEWVQQLKTALTPLFETVATHDYAHWASAGSSIDFEHELRAVQREARGLGSYVVFAKSAGALLTLKGISERILQPEKVIFAGLPLGFAAQYGLELEKWLQASKAPALFIQNAHDPVASSSELDRYLKLHLSPLRFELVELPGDTHDYADFPKLSELTNNFIHKSP